MSLRYHSKLKHCNTYVSMYCKTKNMRIGTMNICIHFNKVLVYEENIKCGNCKNSLSIASSFLVELLRLHFQIINLATMEICTQQDEILFKSLILHILSKFQNIIFCSLVEFGENISQCRHIYLIRKKGQNTTIK